MAATLAIAKLFSKKKDFWIKFETDTIGFNKQQDSVPTKLSTIIEFLFYKTLWLEMDKKLYFIFSYPSVMSNYCIIKS